MASCKLSSEPADPEIRSVQISRFGLSATKVPELAKTVFSIDHRQGLIYNAKPLARGTELDSVAITALTLEYAMIDVKVGGEVVPKSLKDSVYLHNHKQGVELVVTSEDKKRSKTYSVQINIYEHDPLAMDWQRSGVAPEYTGYSATGVTSGLIPGNEGYYYYYSKEGVTHFFEAQTADTWVKWAERSVSLKGIARLSNEVFLMQPASGEAYFLNTRNGGYFPAGFTTEQIMGAYPSPQDPALWEAAALVREGDLLRFARITLQGDTPVLQVGEQVPVSFPVTDFYAYLCPVENRQVLYVIGGYDVSGAEHPYVWSTTTGTDWLTPHNSGVVSGLPQGVAQGAAAYDPVRRVVLYVAARAEKGTTGNPIAFYSADKGVTWQAADSKEVLPPDLLNTPVGKGLVLMPVPEGGFVLFGGGASAPGSGVWKGLYRDR